MYEGIGMVSAMTIVLLFVIGIPILIIVLITRSVRKKTREKLQMLEKIHESLGKIEDSIKKG